MFADGDLPFVSISCFHTSLNNYSKLSGRRTRWATDKIDLFRRRDGSSRSERTETRIAQKKKKNLILGPSRNKRKHFFHKDMEFSHVLVPIAANQIVLSILYTIFSICVHIHMVHTYIHIEITHGPPRISFFQLIPKRWRVMIYHCDFCTFDDYIIVSCSSIYCERWISYLKFCGYNFSKINA